MTDIQNTLSDRQSGSAKRVLLAAPRGYCAGVDRAVIAVEKALDLHGSPIYVRKEIVHNKHVVSTLEQKGVIFVNETDEVPEGKTVSSPHMEFHLQFTKKPLREALRQLMPPVRW